jgi:hypothetical protein
MWLKADDTEIAHLLSGVSANAGIGFGSAVATNSVVLRITPVLVFRA